MTDPKLKIGGVEVKYEPSTLGLARLERIKAKYEKSKLVSCLYDELPPLCTEEDYMKGVSNDFDNLKDGEEFSSILNYIVREIKHEFTKIEKKQYITLSLFDFHAFSVTVCAEEIQGYYNEEDIDFKSLELSDTISLVTICEKNKNSFLLKRLCLQ